MTASTDTPIQHSINWPRHVEAWRESGLPMTRYCRQHGLVLHQFAYYKKKFESLSQPTTIGNFSQVAIANTVETDDLLCLRLSGNLCIEKISQQNLPLVISLVRALQS